MVFNETLGDNDFASIFSSYAEEKRIADEKAQADMLLRLLDEMDERGGRKASPEAPHVEYLRVASNGDVIHDAPVDEAKRGRVMTVDQLPKESEYEMLFGKPQEIEPQLKVETGMRLKDGKQFQNIKFEDISLFSMGPGIKFETVMLILSVIFFIVVLFAKFNRIRQNRKRHERRQDEMQQRQYQSNAVHIENEIERRVRERLNVILMSVNNSCQ